MMRGFVASLTKFLFAAAAAVCLVFPVQSSAQDDPPPQAGRLSIVNGAVSIQPAGSDDWGQAYLNYPVGPGDRIFTDSDGRAEIQVGRTYVRIGPNSDVSFVDFSQDAITFGIAQGALHIRTNGLWDRQSLYVQTPSGSSTVQGPADFRVDVIPDDQAAVFTNYNGDVYVSGANDFGSDTGPGQALELVGTNPVYPQWLQPAGEDDLDRWSERRDVQIARATSFRYVSPEVPGVEDMDAYGEWTPGTDYGDMWVPNVPVGWAPYHNGHWMNHQPWGWVWVEDEPWGYAPFHFGRWVNYRGRWGWVPGPRADHPVWSPALVVFAGGISIGGGGVSAWFPLGPGEAYRPWYPCSPRYIDQVNISNIQASRQVHVQTTYVNIVNVTNVTNITYVNRTTVTAMRQEDFASGRGAAQAAVHVDPQQMAHVQVLARPQVAPTPQATISRPPIRPVSVRAARPVLINAKGMSVAAQPRATPVQPPVRAVQPPKPLPGRTVVAPPPNVRMTPTAQKAMQAQPPVRQTQPQTPNRQVNTPPVPQPRPAIGTGDRNTPPARSTAQPATRPADRQTPPNQAAPATRPVVRTNPAPQAPAPNRPTPDNRPAPAAPSQSQPQPAPRQVRPENQPPNRPAPQQQHPNVEPSPRTAPPPPRANPNTEPKPQTPPSQPRPNVERTAPPPPRSSAEPAQRPGPKQAPAPQPDKNKKPDNKKPDDKDERRPQ